MQAANEISLAVVDVNAMRMRSPNLNTQARPGVLFNRQATRSSAVAEGGEIALTVGPGACATRGKHWAAFAGVYLFTLLLYVRPNDLLPFLGDFPLVKIVAIGVMLTYIISKNNAGERLSIWTLEMTMLMVITALGLLFMPIAASPKDSIDTLFDPYIKTVIIFILMVNLIDRRQRLFSLWKLVVICGAALGVGAIKSYVNGEFAAAGVRIEGFIGGMFENPNDLATALNLLLPLAVLLMLISKGGARLFYLGCTVVLAIGVLITFSRAGFLGLIALSVVLVWKLGRGRRLKTTLAAALVCGILLAATPGGYGNRVTTIFDIEQDQTGSAQGRRMLMELAYSIAIRRPIIGIGMGNFHIYSYRELNAHNAYLEIAAELGMAGLLAYLIVIFAPLLSLYRIERQTRGMRSKSEKEMYWMSVCLQAAFIAYIVCSFFASIQYLWYLYYTAAYAVALRQIHAAEELVGSLPNIQALTVDSITMTKPTRGVLWPSYRLGQGNG